MGGEDRRKAVKSLKDRGVCNLDNSESMDNLAHSVFDSLWNKIESSIAPEEVRNGNTFSLKGRQFTCGPQPSSQLLKP